MLMFIHFLFGTNCMTEDIKMKQLFINILVLVILFIFHGHYFYTGSRSDHPSYLFFSCLNILQNLPQNQLKQCKKNSICSNINYLHKIKDHSVSVYIIFSCT
jgi:hypothetical protein